MGGRTMMLAVLLMTALGLTACEAQRGGESPYGPIELNAAEMETEVTAMLSTSDILDRHRRLVQLMDSLDAANLEGAKTAYNENLSKVDPREARLFANAWSRIDPQDAVEGILGWRYPRIQNQAVLEAVFQWVLSGGGDDARASFPDPSSLPLLSSEYVTSALTPMSSSVA